MQEIAVGPGHGKTEQHRVARHIRHKGGTESEKAPSIRRTRRSSQDQETQVAVDRAHGSLLGPDRDGWELSLERLPPEGVTHFQDTRIDTRVRHIAAAGVAKMMIPVFHLNGT